MHQFGCEWLLVQQWENISLTGGTLLIGGVKSPGFPLSYIAYFWIANY